MSSSGASSGGAGGTAEYGYSGTYFGSQYASQGSSPLTVGQVTCVPIFLGRSIACSRISLQVMTVAAAGGLARLGVYADTGAGHPGNLLLDAGTVATDGSTGVKEIVINQSFGGGLIWVAGMGEVASASVLDLRGTRLMPITSSTFNAVGSGAAEGVYQTGVPAGALPAVFTAAVNVHGNPPCMMLKAA